MVICPENFLNIFDGFCDNLLDVVVCFFFSFKMTVFDLALIPFSIYMTVQDLCI